MHLDKTHLINKIFNNETIRTIWSKEEEKYYISIVEYAILTNEIYKQWSGMTAKEYKAYKGLRKEALRDSMSDI